MDVNRKYPGSEVPQAIIIDSSIMLRYNENKQVAYLFKNKDKG